jgi:hypothetical protein
VNAPDGSVRIDGHIEDGLPIERGVATPYAVLYKGDERTGSVETET